MPRIALWTPAPRGSRRGNRVTSERWARLLRSQGFEVVHSHRPPPQFSGPLIGLHALHAREVLLAWKGGPRIAVVTGTDLRGPHSQEAFDTLRQVEAVVVLQPQDLPDLEAGPRARAQVILPSVELPPGLRWQGWESRVACTVGHLRTVKNPLALPRALALAPNWSGLHLGGELEAGWADQFQGLERFRWLGERSRAETLRRMSRCGCFVIPSFSEGCSNALCEAVALGMPVLASDIPGNRGLLGDGFPGYFPADDVRALAKLLEQPKGPCPEELRTLLSPQREAAQLASLLGSLMP